LHPIQLIAGMSKPLGPVQEQWVHRVAKAGPAPVNVSEYERYAHDSLPRNAYDYYASGANDMISLQENRAAFGRLRLIPKMLVDVSNIDMQTTILGEKIAFPICVAPTAMQQMANEGGEVATAKAADRHGTLMTLSSWSTLSIEDVAQACPSSLRWFQLYVYKDREVTLDLIKRAERAGYKALAVTVDAPILGRREADIRNRFALPSHLTMGNFTSQGGEHAAGTKESGSKGSGLASYVAGLIDRTLTWDDIDWLKTVTSMKIVVKGVMSKEDALLGVKHGVDGIWVSNHGARQLDTVPAGVEVLKGICEVVAGRAEVYVDGGVTRGTDALKALALGARAVFVGRPILWGLAHSGEDGVFNVLNLLKEELHLAMALSGCTKIADIKPSMVRTAMELRSRL